MTHFARAVAPPKYRTMYARNVAWILSAVMLAMALLHLVRIDKLVPIVDVAVPGDVSWAVMFVVATVVMEVFALPFLLGLRLSPLARIVGGLFSVMVPLVWTLITIWASGDYQTTGQFSPYIDIAPNLGLLVLNYLWLAASYWGLWLLSYDKSFPRSHKLKQK